MESVTLPNGLRVLVDPRGVADVAAVYLWIDVGSADEEPGLEGAAHVVEHMVFKGTASYGVGGLARAVEGVGGDINAWTSFDETVFHATVPAAAVGEAVHVLAEMATSARMDPDELDRERDVILEEIRSGRSDPEMVAGEGLYACLFGAHPYGRPIIGTTRSVARMPREDLLAFYRRWYTPSNATLVVVGPVDPGAVRAAAARHLGAEGARPVRARRPSPAPTARRRTLRRGFDTAVLQRAWALPAVGHPSLPAWDLLAGALGGGSSSPLEVRLRLRDRLCLGAEASCDLERDASAFVVHLHPREGASQAATAALEDELARIRGGGLGRADLERARARVRGERVFARETVDGRAHSLAWHAARVGDPEGFRAWDAAVDAVTLDELRAHAKTLLDPARAVQVDLLPGDAPAAPRGVRTARSGGAPVAPGPRHVHLDNGVRLLLEPDEGCEVAAVRVVGLGGALLEPAERAGLAAAWGRVVLRGAGRRDAEGFAGAVESRGGSVAAASGRSTQAVQGEFPAPSFAIGLDHVLDVVLAPRIEPAEVDAARAEQLDALSERDDHPEDHLGEMLGGMLFPDSPWARPALGWPSTTRRVDVPALRRLHARWLAGGLVVAVCGSFDLDEVESHLRTALGGLPATRRVAPGPLRPGPGGRRVRRAGHEQAHLAVGLPGVAVSDPRQPAMDLLMAVLGGQGGRLFVELREERGLAYAVSAGSHEGLDRGLVQCVLATEPERVDEAERALLASLDRARSGGIAGEEVARARAWLLGGIAHELQTAAARARSLATHAVLGLGEGDVAGRVRRGLEAVRVEDVNTLARGVLGATPAVARVLPRPGGR